MRQGSKLSKLAANEQANALAALLNGGFLRIYSGKRPDSPDAKPGADHIQLAELRFGTPAFAVAVDGVLRSLTLTPDDEAEATGNASWYRCFKADGTTPVLDGTVGVKDADLVINSVAIQKNARVSITEFIHVI